MGVPGHVLEYMGVRGLLETPCPMPNVRQSRGDTRWVIVLAFHNNIMDNRALQYWPIYR